MKTKHLGFKSSALMAMFGGFMCAFGLLPVVHAATSCVNPGGTDGCYGSVQSAVDAAGNGDTINVSTGTYSEGVIISKALTLQAIGTPIIHGCFSISSDNVTVNGFSFDGGDLCPNAGEKGAIYMVANTSGHTLAGNALNGPGTSQVYRGILFGYSVSDVTISGNDITGWLSGIYINPSSDILIEGNTFFENYVGIGSDGLSNVSILGNTFSDNEFEGWGSSAVGANVQAEGNRFNGNNGIAVAHYSGEIINAANNWWGDNGGPTHASNPGGTGDVVTDNVLFVPWLTETSTWGAASITGAEYNRPSGLAIYFFLLLMPMGAMLAWKGLMRRR